MKSTIFFLLVVGTMLLSGCEQTNSSTSTEPSPSTPGREFYQLKIYTFATDEQVQMTDRYLQAAFMPALKKLGIQPIGVFKPKPLEADTVRRTYVLIPFPSMDAFASYESRLLQDETFVAAGDEYVNATHDRPPYQRIESVILRAFEDMPQMYAPTFDSPRTDRVYELRSYESATEEDHRNKVDMFNAGGEVELLQELGFNAVFYGEVISGANMPNLMYMTTFSDQASRDTHWDAFRDAPKWLELKAMPKYQNNVSRNDTRFLYPTAYSDY